MGRLLTQGGGRLLTQAGEELLTQTTVTVAGQWTGSYAATSGFFFPFPGARPLQVPVTNTAGDWLFALVAWRPAAAGSGVSVCVADDAHNWWEPVGSPSADSDAAGAVRTAVWAAPAARVANTGTGVTVVQVAPTGPVLSLACLIVDMSGLLPWYEVAAIGTSSANAAASLPVSASAPSVRALLFAAFASDNNSDTVTGPSGWTALTGATASNGTDHTADITLTPAWQVAAPVAPVTPAADGTFESGVSQWVASDGTVVQTTAHAYTGTHSAQVTCSASPPSQVTLRNLFTGTAVPVVPGVTYDCTLRILDGNGRTYEAAIDWYTSGGTRISTSAGPVATSASSFTRYSVNDTAPQGAAVAVYGPTLTTPSAGAQFYVDDVTFAAASLASVTSTGSQDLAGVIAGVVVSAPQPQQQSTDWPVMITEAAVGAGVQTPPSQLTWTDLSSRALSMSMTQGRQYSLAQLSAGQGTLVLDDPDGSLIPPGTGSFAGIDSGTPVRRRVIIPATPTPHYVAMNGYFRRWPWNMDAVLYRGKTQTEIADAWAYATVQLNSMAAEECLLDSPHSLWPLTDPAGSAGGSNLAAGNTLPLVQVTSKYGAGGATTAWGQNSGFLVGAQGARVTSSGAAAGTAGMWQQKLAGQSLGVNGYGYALQCTDASYPPISGGVTVECWTTASMTAIGPGIISTTATAASSSFAWSLSIAGGSAVQFSVASGFTFPGGITAGQTYYVLGNGGTSGVQVSATPGGSPVTVTSDGYAYTEVVIPWDPVIFSARDGKGGVFGLSVRGGDGALLLLHRSGTSLTSTVADSSRDYRNAGYHYSLSVTQTSWRILTDGGEILTASGTFSPALPASFRTLCFAGVQDSTQQGYALSGTVGFPGVFPGFSQQARVVSRYWATGFGMALEDADGRIERILEYAGLTGRRWLGQQVVTGEGDLCVSGQDIGGQAAASSCSNIAQSTLPAMLYVAPTGDVVYLSKLYAWNQPVRWTLGTNAAAGEIPFTPGSIATDYDPSRVTEDVQLTQLDTQAVTLPSGVMAASTMAQVAAATEKQYGGSTYQQTGYLQYDGSSQYTAGGGLNDLANWLANVYARPANRIQSVTVNAVANSANVSAMRAWQFWAGASPGDMATVNVRVPTASASPLISLTARITQTRRQSAYSTGGTSATISCVLDFAPEYNALVADDPVRGLLNGQNCLPW